LQRGSARPPEGRSENAAGRLADLPSDHSRTGVLCAMRDWITLAARSGLHPVHGQANCAINMRYGRHCAATGLLWSGSGRFHAHGCKLRRALAGPWRPRVDRNLPQPDGILNLIGGSGSLEQSAPSPLQVAVSFNWILKGAGHGCLLVSAAVPAPWPSGIQFPNSLSGDAVPTGMGGRGASPVAVGGSGRSRSGTR